MSDSEFKARVERAAFALERQRKSGYCWTDDQFDTWWNRDPNFNDRVTAWGSGFRGTHKQYLFHEVETVLRAAE